MFCVPGPLDMYIFSYQTIKKSVFLFITPWLSLAFPGALWRSLVPSRAPQRSLAVPVALWRSTGGASAPQGVPRKSPLEPPPGSLRGDYRGATIRPRLRHDAKSKGKRRRKAKKRKRKGTAKKAETKAKAEKAETKAKTERILSHAEQVGGFWKSAKHTNLKGKVRPVYWRTCPATCLSFALIIFFLNN